MKIAALSDIHSNVFALDAVIGDAKRRGAEMMLNLGDVFYGPIAPRATYDLLAEHEFVTISGNQDRQLHEATAEEIESNPTLQFVLNDLGADPVAWLESLPFDYRLNDEIYLCHGSPTDDLEYLLENVESGHARLRSDREIVQLLGGQQSNLIICGHTHTPRTVLLDSGQLIVNPGSVGLPAYTDDEPVAHAMENFSPHAAYAMIEKCADGWTVQNILVPYDYRKAAAEAKKQNRDDWAWFLSTGRGH
ncbi:MAG: metallophosphoesterase family protein [bacterium]|nr:metallophosphoesterase family protein [bacterium]